MRSRWASDALRWHLVRTTLDIDATVLAELRARQRREGRTLSQLASELLARALADTEPPPRGGPLRWETQSMRARVDLEDVDAVNRVLDRPRIDRPR